MAEIVLKSKRIKVPASFEEANNYLYEMGWTDGLPVIPPTPERVRAMLSTVDRDPQEIVGCVGPVKTTVIIEKIAINAVMAGCLPEYFPVVLAAIEAMVSDSSSIWGLIGTHAVAPLLVINGPVRKKLGINCEYNALGSGYRPNATIGRAVAMGLINIARVAVRPALEGVPDQTTLGQPARFTFCMAENEEANPWEPLQVERGFGRSDSTVSVFHGGGYHNILEMHSKTAKGLLTQIAGSMTPLGSNHMCLWPGLPLLCLCPEHANRLAREGLSKEDVKRYLYENAKVPLSSFSEDVAEHLRQVNMPAADGAVHVAQSPDHIAIVVVGGLGPHSAFVPGMGVNKSAVIKRIVLSAP